MVHCRLFAAVLTLASLMPAAATAADHAVILLYHHVADDTPAVTSVSPEHFAQHLRYLEEHGFHVLPLAELVEGLRTGKPLPERSVAITFDDGYRSVLTNAAPLLAARHWPFTVFVSTDYIDRHYGHYLSWPELRQLQQMGASIGNHSRSHAHLVRMRAGESEEEWRLRARHEIDGAQQRLKDALGVTERLFAYPYGEFSRPLQMLVAQMGYVAFGQQSGAVGYKAERTALPRFPLTGRYADEEAFALRVNARPLPVALPAEQRTLLPADTRRPSLSIRLGEGAFRSRQVRCYYQGKAMELQWQDQQSFAITAPEPLPAGRSKYTCTAPATDRQGGYFWYSHLWIIPRADGSWPGE